MYLTRFVLIYFNLKSDLDNGVKYFCTQTIYSVDWYAMFEGTFNVLELLFYGGLNLFVMYFKRRFLRSNSKLSSILYDAANLTNFGHFQTDSEF